jgi:hypothetical protein
MRVVLAGTMSPAEWKHTNPTYRSYQKGEAATWFSNKNTYVLPCNWNGGTNCTVRCSISFGVLVVSWRLMPMWLLRRAALAAAETLVRAFS